MVANMLTSKTETICKLVTVTISFWTATRVIFIYVFCLHSVIATFVT